MRAVRMVPVLMTMVTFAVALLAARTWQPTGFFVVQVADDAIYLYQPPRGSPAWKAQLHDGCGLTIIFRAPGVMPELDAAATDTSRTEDECEAFYAPPGKGAGSPTD